MDQMQNIEGMPQSDKQNGPVVGIIIVIIVLAIGGYYLFTQLQAQKAQREMDAIQQGDITENSNNITDIQADVQAQQDELDALDAETEADLQQLDAELNAQ